MHQTLLSVDLQMKTAHVKSVLSDVDRVRARQKMYSPPGSRTLLYRAVLVGIQIWMLPEKRLY